jgi:hypothetical protein
MRHEDAEKRLADILGLIERAGVTDALRPTVFQCLWNSLGAPAANEKGAEQQGQDATGPMLRLAQRLGVEASLLTDIYEQDDEGALMPRIPSARLENAVTHATRQLALLVCAGRQCSVEHATSLAIVRRVCDEHGKLDAPNFNKALKAGDQYWIMSGSGPNRTLKLRNPGWEAAKEMVQRTTGSNQ